jgi:DNA-directed RNA polymerase subunit RPC12/RpoP
MNCPYCGLELVWAGFDPDARETLYRCRKCFKTFYESEVTEDHPEDKDEIPYE